MGKCPNCKSTNYVQRCMECLHSETPKVKKGVLPCEWPCTATIHVTESQTGRPIQGIYTRLDGASEQTDASGFRVVEKLKPGSHAAGIVAATLGDNYAFPIGGSSADVTKPIAAGENQFYSFVLDPLRPLKVVVRRRTDSNGVANAKVTVAPGKAGNTVQTPEQTTPGSGEVIFKRLRQDTYKVTVELDDPGKKKYELEKAEDQHPLDMTQNPDELVLWARLVVHLRLKYLCPDTKSRFFPKDFPVTVVFGDNTTKDLKILDDEGYLKFPIEDDKKKNFTLKFDSTKARYLVHPAREVPDPNVNVPGARKDLPKTKVFEDPTEEQLLEWTTDNKKLFALPKTWSLVHSDWDVVDVTVKADGKIDVNDGVGLSDKPAELTLKPKFQYVRFEFHDRKYGAKGDAHDGKRVSIPAVVLKACRESTDAGAPVNPIAGTHDAVSNWLIKPGEADKACQVLPWIKVKDDAGTALPKLNNKMMLEFGWKDGFVESTGKEPKDRQIITIPTADDRRKPTKNRPQYYDLPETWKSKWYYTRLSDEAKNKFFDKFLAADDPELEASLAEGGKLTFSLDDIVLTANDGKQETIQDKKNSDDSAVAFSKYSRIAILELNRENHPTLNKKMFNVKVFDPQDDAKYWSKTAFAAEVADTGPWRNVIAKYPFNPRLVVFCNDFYDIYDKRTKPADCSGKKIMGARAARHEDTDISSKKVLMDQAAHADNAYVGYKGTLAPRWHYLHYADVEDATTVYGALVVYWSASFQRSTEPMVPLNDGSGGTRDPNGTHADVDLFRDKGLALAMQRWNDKDYYFEENDDKTELRIKTFALFEAKGVKIADGNFSDTGGKPICQVSVRDDTGGSWAYSDGSQMMMRKSGAKDEGEKWGQAVGTLPNIPRWEGGSANPKCAFAHELGHSAFALYDLYLTTYGKLCETGNKNKKLSTILCCYENMYADKRDGQEYLGMPYEMDGGGLMKSNRAETRLREAWLRANWLNDMAKPGGVDKLPDLLNKRRFRAVYEFAGKPKLKYHREDDDRQIYKPSKTGANYALANHGKCDMHLYHLGDDEYARILKGGPYNGILVVAIKICVKFVDTMPWAKKAKYFVDDVVTHNGKFQICKTEHTNKDFDANDWTEVNDYVNGTVYVGGNYVSQNDMIFRHDGVGVGDAGFSGAMHEPMDQDQKVAQMEFLNQKILTALADADVVGKFKVYGTGKYSNTLVRVFPQWSYETDPGGAHITLTYSPTSKAFQPDGVNIKAGTSCETDTIIRYLLGKLSDDPTKWAAEGLTGDLVRADFAKLSDWMNSNAGTQGFIVADNA